ncbi:hypothetical protein CRE_03663 [Caenorhabditis remanei]|uniref:Uncharacterized protein n=1 Tax=Caenorhabditis remanei TaxID=31234 RepID=E3LXJ5_CAERE|nr:hypothetical protein CRE_03663 [Caenorhabditis remanei]
MTEQERHQYIPEHPVPLTLETIANSKTERFEFGKVSVVRVQVIAIVESIEIKDNSLVVLVTDEKRQNRVMVQKVISSSFPRNRAEELLVGDFVDIVGKMRVMENGTSFLNALGLDIVGRAQHDCYVSLCQISKVFYEKNLPSLPSGTQTKVPTKLGLKKKVGSLDRFPMEMLEESSSVENNMGVWPKEIEELAAGASTSGMEVDPFRTESSDSDDDSEDSDEDEEESEEESDTEDSFDAGPPKTEPVEQVKSSTVQESQMETDDSFEAGPALIIPVKEPKIESGKVGTEIKEENIEVEFDSFENI